MMVRYDSHDKEWDEIINDEEKKLLGDSWKNNNTLDSYAHDRQRRIFIEILKNYKNPKILTLGDGRYGNDALFFIRHGYKTHASDYSDKLLKIAYEENLLEQYSAQNAESITFEDESFDFVLIKEALHHCPRPNLAISEMLRVAKKGIFINEPRDHFINMNIFFKIILIFYRVIKGKSFPKHTYEKVGNYVFSLSEREIEKTALGLNYNNLAFKDMNTTYLYGEEFINLKSKKLSDRFTINFWKFKVLLFDILSKLRIIKSLVISAVIFKEEPSKEIKDRMKKRGWRFVNLPKNPYI